MGTLTENIKRGKKWAFGHKTVKNAQKWPKNAIYCTYKNKSQSRKSPKNPLFQFIIMNAILPNSATFYAFFRKKVANYCTYKNKNMPKYPIYCTYKNTKMNYCTYRK